MNRRRWKAMVDGQGFLVCPRTGSVQILHNELLRSKMGWGLSATTHGWKNPERYVTDGMT